MPPLLPVTVEAEVPLPVYVLLSYSLSVKQPIELYW